VHGIARHVLDGVGRAVREAPDRDFVPWVGDEQVAVAYSLTLTDRAIRRAVSMPLGAQALTVR
jgi:hypothetical protein